MVPNYNIRFKGTLYSYIVKQVHDIIGTLYTIQGGENAWSRL